MYKIPLYKFQINSYEGKPTDFFIYYENNNIGHRIHYNFKHMTYYVVNTDNYNELKIKIPFEDDSMENLIKQVPKLIEQYIKYTILI